MDNQSKQAASEFFQLALTIYWSYCALIFVAQIYYFLKTGMWIHAPAINLLLTPSNPSDISGPNLMYPIGLADGTWFSAPNSWTGLFMVVSWVLSHTHVSIALFLLGVAFMVAYFYALDVFESISRQSSREPEGQ